MQWTLADQYDVANSGHHTADEDLDGSSPQAVTQPAHRYCDDAGHCPDRNSVQLALGRGISEFLKDEWHEKPNRGAGNGNVKK